MYSSSWVEVGFSFWLALPPSLSFLQHPTLLLKSFLDGIWSCSNIRSLRLTILDISNNKSITGETLAGILPKSLWFNGYKIF